MFVSKMFVNMADVAYPLFWRDGPASYMNFGIKE
jgi:hypothetical protein